MAASSSLPLRSNFLWTFAGNIVYAGCQWGMLVTLAKLGTPEMVGQFAFGLAVTAPILMFFNLQLRAVQATDSQHEYNFEHYLGLRLVTTTLALIVIAALVAAGGYESSTAQVILLLGAAKAIESVSDLFYGVLQKNERMDRIAISMVIKGVLSLSAVGVGVFVSRDIVIGLIGLLGSWTLVLLMYDLPNSQWILANINGSIDSTNKAVRGAFFKQKLLSGRYWQTLLKLTWSALPLGFVMMLISLNSNIPRYFIEHYGGPRELGIFSAIAYFQTVGTLIISALGQSTIPRLAKYYLNELREAFRNLLLKLVGVGILLGLGGILIAAVFGKQILEFCYQAEYANHAGLFVWIMIASGIGYIGSFLGYGITATRKFHDFTVPYLSSTTLSAAASLLLIPQFGLLGAAWTACIISLSSCLIPLFILHQQKDTA